MSGEGDDLSSKTNRWNEDFFEEDYFKENRKEGKIQRKIASAKDRSKYKKTDREKFQKQADDEKLSKLDRNSLSEGRVLSIVPQGIMVEHLKTGKEVVCVLRGILKRDKSLFKNLVTVGDFVLYEETSPGEGVIASVEPRYSVLSRADNLSQRKEQLIAANIDQVLITVSVVDPPLKPPLVDRYIIATQKGRMKPVIIVNKVDLLKGQVENVDPLLLQQEQTLYEQFLQAYAFAGIPVISMSIVDGKGLDELKEVMKGKASVFSGQSGVGKTSLINIITGLDLRVGKTVERTKKGSHTTTTAQLLKLDFGGWCIDTPGIKSFGVWDLKKDELEQYFEEIYARGRKCKYPDCSHQQEANCAVIKAVEDGEISSLRYASYLYLVQTISQSHLRR